MRHRVKNNELSRNTGHRRALNKFMATSFVEKGYLTTTLPKAKFIQPFIEKAVTKAKENNINSVRFLKASLNTRLSIDMMLQTIAPKFAERKGGYTRIIKLGNRVGDNASLARIEWVEKMETKKAKTAKEEKVEKAKEVKKTRKTAKKD